MEKEFASIEHQHNAEKHANMLADHSNHVNEVIRDARDANSDPLVPLHELRRGHLKDLAAATGRFTDPRIIREHSHKVGVPWIKRRVTSLIHWDI